MKLWLLEKQGWDSNTATPSDHMRTICIFTELPSIEKLAVLCDDMLEFLTVGAAIAALHALQDKGSYSQKVPYSSYLMEWSLQEIESDKEITR